MTAATVVVRGLGRVIRDVLSDNRFAHWPRQESDGEALSALRRVNRRLA